MNLQLAGDIPSMGNNGIDGNKEVVSNLLIGHSLYQGDDDIFLTITQLFITLRSLGYHT